MNETPPLGTPPMSTPFDHEQLRTRLELLALGLLDGTTETQLQQHVSGCPECRESLATIRQSWLPSANDGHVPVSLLARWPAVARTIPAQERELVERHIARCAECRQDLEHSQHPAFVHTTSASTQRHARRWERAWAVAASVVAVSSIGLWWTDRRPAPAPQDIATKVNAVPLRMTVIPVGPAMTGARRAQQQMPGLDLQVVEGDLLSLRVTPLDVPDDTPIRIELLRTDGALLASLDYPQRALYPDRQVVVGERGHPLPVGSYELRMVAWPGTSHADTQSHHFSVSRPAH